MIKRLIALLFLFWIIIHGCLIVVCHSGKNDLVIWLKFDGNLRDSSGNGHHGEARGIVRFAEGRKGKAILLDDKGYVYVRDAPDFSIVNNPNGMTISFWICPSTHSFKTQNEYGYIRFLGKGDTGQYEWCFSLYNGSHPERPYRLCFYIHNASGGYGIGAYVQEPWDVGEWIFVTGVIKNNVLYIYKNGVFKRQSYNYSEPNPIGIIIPQDTSSPLCIGTRMDVNEFFEGKIDDFRIYNRALSDQEIYDLFQSYFVPDPIEEARDWMVYGFVALILIALGMSIFYRMWKA
ncbi:MAG: LamG domain-containing protein [Candidatus Aenigmatarchaeota archaeon]